MNAPVIISHRRSGDAGAPLDPWRGRRGKAPVFLRAPSGCGLGAVLGVVLGVALVSCTLTHGDFEPVLTEAGAIQPAPPAESSAPTPEGCSASLECPDGFACVGEVCVPQSSCDAAEDIAACVVDACIGEGCEAACNDGVQGEDEAGVDCGGACAPCTAAAGCTSDAECAPGACVAGRCADPSCEDGLTNQDETGADCGGAACPRCALGAGCDADADCDEGLFCPAMTGACSPVSCQDDVQNGAERGVDCGGGECPGCEVDTACDAPADCGSSSCVEGRCAEPSCEDTVRNGEESDVDCGGGCAPCPNGLRCVAPADCASAVCDVQDCATDGTSCCQAPSCDDGVQNGPETAIDCGAAPCTLCGVGSACSDGPECASNVCSGARCAELCDDGLRNGDEGGADCGGSETGCPRCEDGQPCASGSDCSSGSCVGALCVSCSDGLRNGDEAGVDCGGSERGCPVCPRCNADNSIDLGRVGAITTLAGDACARITAFPGYAPTLFDSFETGSFPVTFSFRQECSELAGTGTFDGPFDRVTIGGLSIDCPVIFDFAGTAPFQVRWF